VPEAARDAPPAWTADRAHLAGSAPYEASAGYARAVRVGPFVAVAGTTGLGDDGRVVAGGAYAQARRALDIVLGALRRAGAAPEDVVRTRLYVTAAEHAGDVTRAHAEVLGHVRPAATLVVVAGLIDPAMLVEVEADAIVGVGPVTGRAADSA
jgi:enamine deaminase RidA (YjgF/YER057c/UK114 family)